MAYKIFIDPGHGGSDSGAVGNGLVEKDLNLTVSLALSTYLRNAGIDVALSRTDDRTISINERARMSDAFGANYCISVHHNAGGGVGFEVIHPVQYGNGQRLAENIQNTMKAYGWVVRPMYSKKNDRGQDYFGMIRIPKASAIITEGGFVDNAKDAEFLKQEGRLKEEAEIFAKGICLSLGVPFVPIQQTTPQPIPNPEPVIEIPVVKQEEQLPSVNDCTQEFMWRGIITNKSLWDKYGAEDKNVFWLLVKSYKYIMANGGSIKGGMSSSDDALAVLNRCNIAKNFDLWNGKAFEDKNIYWLIMKIADYVN